MTNTMKTAAPSLGTELVQERLTILMACSSVCPSHDLASLLGAQVLFGSFPLSLCGSVGQLAIDFHYIPNEC